MVIGGAVGNVVDRVLYRAVADFFDFHAFGYHWYIFNIADVGIVVGVAVLVLESFLQPQAVGNPGGSPGTRAKGAKFADKSKDNRENLPKSTGIKQ